MTIPISGTLTKHSVPREGYGQSRLGAVRKRRRRTRQMEGNNPPHLACLSAHLSEGWQRALESSHAPSRENRKVFRPWPRVLRGDKSSMHVTASSIGTNSKTGNIEFFFRLARSLFAPQREPLPAGPNLLPVLGLFRFRASPQRGIPHRGAVQNRPPRGTLDNSSRTASQHDSTAVKQALQSVSLKRKDKLCGLFPFYRKSRLSTRRYALYVLVPGGATETR